MPRGPKADFFGGIRAQAAKILQQLERQIGSLEEELSHLREQFTTWQQLAGGRGVPTRRAGRPVGRPPGATKRARSGGQRVKWDEVLAFVPKRFGVQDVMKHPGAAAKGRAQVYPALNRWESTKRIRRVGKGIYEKGGGAEPAQPAAKRGPAAKGKKRAAKRGRPPGAKTAEAKAS
jgi:hypothetical protein